MEALEKLVDGTSPPTLNVEKKRKERATKRYLKKLDDLLQKISEYSGRYDLCMEMYYKEPGTKWLSLGLEELQKRDEYLDQFNKLVGRPTKAERLAAVESEKTA